MPFKSALDRSFPSAVFLAIALLAAIGLIAILGWKIFALETERSEIERERLLLERDRDAFLTYGGELPQMTERHRRLTVEVNELTGRSKALMETSESLQIQCGELERKAARLGGAIVELQSQLQSLEASAAAERAELERLRPEQAQARKDLAQLETQAEALRESIAQKQKQETTLTANLEGLERTIAHNRELLERMTADNEAYARFEKKLGEIGKRFDAVIGRADAHAGQYGAHVEVLGKFLARMDHSLALLDSDREAFGSNLEAFKKDRSAFGALLKQNGEQNRSLQAQVDAVAANSRKFQTAMETVRSLDSKLQAALAAETASLRKMANEDGQTRASLAQTAATLGHVSEALKGGIDQLKDAGNGITAMLGAQKEDLQALLGKADDLAAIASRLEAIGRAGMESGAKLAQISDSVAGQTRAIEERLQEQTRHSGNLDAGLTEQAGRLKELGALARGLASEIEENRRRSATLEALLQSIQSQGAAKAEQEP